MKNTILKVVFSLAVVLLCASCSSSLRYSGEGASVNVAVNVKDLEANVSVGEKITGTAKEAYLFGFFKTSSSGPKLVGAGVGGGSVCQAAAYDAVSNSNADVIVNPQYALSKESNLFTSVEECTVTGYKGTIDSIK
tara:strand:+ start:3982 stop:4389 length:408 start_codon:yes stop_codon:yes gene_type:complete